MIEAQLGEQRQGKRIGLEETTIQVTWITKGREYERFD
jgi:hypothetical protein